ncbi:MAG: selenide, water dikinase SelD [Alphaproteobacteria bacterium]
MKSDHPITHDIVLVGGGHSHVAVLKRFAMRPVPGARLTLVTRDAVTPYSGMLPGMIAGHYTHDEAHIDLRKLATFAGARLYHTAADGIDPLRREVRCVDRPAVPYDLLSIDIGSAPRQAGIEGAREHALPVKPVDGFLEGLAAIEARAKPGFRIVVIGGGAGGVELALSLRHRLRAVPDLSVTVVSDSAEPLPNHAPAVRRLVARFARDAGVAIKTGTRVERVAADHLETSAGRIEHDSAILVTDAAPAAWLADTGLALDEKGFVRVAMTLESTSHPGVFAAGDIAAIDGRPLPKAGVYAVREGPVLADNLARAVRGQPLRPYRPQKRVLALISNGEKHALASYGPLAFDGAWVWRWKDWIDRRWMKKYQELPEMEKDEPDAAPMRCGGCGAKVPSAVLQRALASVRPAAAEGVLVGLDAPDDAAVLTAPPGQALVQSVDHFRPFVDDPYLFARIATNHCLGDLYAMGASPHSAQLSLTLPYGPEDKTEALLTDLLRGTCATLEQAGVALVGGHTGEGPELSLGLTVNGFAAPETLLRKGGLRVGDRLILTKAMGTGAIFAADMAAKARAEWVEAALAAMQRSNAEAATILRAHGASACTDVTGFGLAGHLIEMLRAAGVAATIDPAALPVLPGADELLRQGIRSTLHPSNEAFAIAVDGGAAAILYDPQTAGGLLAGVPAARAEACVTALRQAGDTAAAQIGEVVAAESGALIRLTCAAPAGRAIQEAADD